MSDVQDESPRETPKNVLGLPHAVFARLDKRYTPVLDRIFGSEVLKDIDTIVREENLPADVAKHLIASDTEARDLYGGVHYYGNMLGLYAFKDIFTDPDIVDSQSLSDESTRFVGLLERSLREYRRRHLPAVPDDTYRVFASLSRDFEKAFLQGFLFHWWLTVRYGAVPPGWEKQNRPLAPTHLRPQRLPGLPTQIQRTPPTHDTLPTGRNDGPAMSERMRVAQRVRNRDLLMRFLDTKRPDLAGPGANFDLLYGQFEALHATMYDILKAARAYVGHDVSSQELRDVWPTLEEARLLFKGPPTSVCIRSEPPLYIHYIPITTASHGAGQGTSLEADFEALGEDPVVISASPDTPNIRLETGADGSVSLYQDRMSDPLMLFSTNLFHAVICNTTVPAYWMALLNIPDNKERAAEVAAFQMVLAQLVSDSLLDASAVPRQHSYDPLLWEAFKGKTADDGVPETQADATAQIGESPSEPSGVVARSSPPVQPTNGSSAQKLARKVRAYDGRLPRVSSRQALERLPHWNCTLVRRYGDHAIFKRILADGTTRVSTLPVKKSDRLNRYTLEACLGKLGFTDEERIAFYRDVRPKKK
jgi:hypothetical protein